MQYFLKFSISYSFTHTVTDIALAFMLSQCPLLPSVLKSVLCLVLRFFRSVKVAQLLIGKTTLFNHLRSIVTLTFRKFRKI